MAAVSEIIVREYFELRGFLVRQQRKYVSPSPREEEEIDFFVLNPQPRAVAGERPFVLRSEDLPRLERAVVGVKGWHVGCFTPAMVAKEPEMFRFAEAASVKQAARFFGGSGPVVRLLVVGSLPQSEQARAQSLEVLRAKGVDAVLPFRTLLAELVSSAETHRNYQKSDLLQILRLLKDYDFLREPQMELFKARRTGSRRASSPGPVPGGSATAEADAENAPGRGTGPADQG